MSQIVIVDDHAGFRAMARRIFDAGGLSVSGEAADCAGALAQLAEGLPDLVLIDVQLPDGDGIELARRLTKTYPSLKIILTSSRERSDYEQRLAELPSVPFVWKPDLDAQGVLSLAG